MVYTAPRTWIDEISDAADFNVDIRDNQLALKAPPTDDYTVAALTTIGGATFVDFDSTNLSLSITTTGGDVMIGFIGTFDGGLGYLDVLVDGTTRLGGSNGIAIIGQNANDNFMSICRIVHGLSAGAHTFTLQGRTITGVISIGSALLTVHPQFWVREMS